MAIAFAGLGLCACASLPRNPFGPLPIDPTSPVAAQIRKTDVRAAAYPSFLQVPSQPTDVRPVSAWNRNIFEVLADRRRNNAIEMTYPQTIYGAEAFAQENRAQAAPTLTPEEATALKDQSTAFATQERARATPPSPAH